MASDIRKGETGEGGILIMFEIIDDRERETNPTPEISDRRRNAFSWRKRIWELVSVFLALLLLAVVITGGIGPNKSGDLVSKYGGGLPEFSEINEVSTMYDVKSLSQETGATTISRFQFIIRYRVTVGTKHGRGGEPIVTIIPLNWDVKLMDRAVIDSGKVAK